MRQSDTTQNDQPASPAAPSILRSVTVSRVTCRLIVLLVIGSSPASQASEETSLIGLWDSAATSSGGIGQTLEFRADGTFVEATTVIVDGYYRLIDDRIIVGEQPPGPDAETASAPRIKINGDLLVETDPDGSIVRKERIGPKVAGVTGIVGAWRYRHYTKAIAFERYTNDGRMLFRLPMISAVGHYSLDGNELLLAWPSKPEMRMAIEIRGDALRLSRDGRTTDYRRDKAGPWYEREHIAE